MSLYSRAVVIFAIVALVLVVVASLFIVQTGPSVSRADASRIFSAQCQEYVQRGCPWSVTREPKFTEYMSACRTLYGNEREAASCIYALCAGCKETEVSDIECDGICSICKGNAAAGLNTEECLSNYETRCTAECNIFSGE